MDEVKTVKTVKTQQSENVIAGIVGAFLLSLVGGLVWFLLYQADIIASFSGLIGVILAIKGYGWFAKKESIKGVIIASIIAFLVLVLAWYLCLGKDIYEACWLWYQEGEIEFPLTFSESLKVAPDFLTDPEIGPEYFKDLAMGLLFAVIGSVGTVITTLKNVKNRNMIPEEAVETATLENIESNNE